MNDYRERKQARAHWGKPLSGWRVALMLVVAATALGATGCRRRHRVHGPVSARHVQNMVRTAARDTGCDAAQLTPVQIVAEPPVFAVMGCGVPIEYHLQCRRGRRWSRGCRWRNVPRLNESAAPVLQCAPQNIQQQPAQAPHMRFAIGCGRIAPFSMTCNGVACAWGQAGPVQQNAPMAPPQARAPQASAPPMVQAPVQPPVVQAPGQPAAGPRNLTIQLRAQREAILSCIDDDTLLLGVRWTAEGQVIVQLPAHLNGTAAEGCVQAALGTLHVQSGDAGEIQIPIQ